MRFSGLSFALISLAALASPAIAQTAPDGGALFNQRCSMCHEPPAGQAHGIGPNLGGVVGRKAASTDYPYSAALKDSRLVWDQATLGQFLKASGQLVPGTRMAIVVTDAAQRAAIIDYLASRKK